MSNKEKHYVYRDAATGEFVTEDFAKANPKTTIREEVELLTEVPEPTTENGSLLG